MIPSDLGLPSKFSSFRSEVEQEKVIIDIASSNKRFELLIAPTGSGKTLIAQSAARLLDARSLTLTCTRSQQSQIDRDFSSMGVVSISGHSNYSCASVSYDHESGELLDMDCPLRQTNDCYYDKKVLQVLSSNVGSVSNYSHWIQLAKSGKSNLLGNFDILILDEAHSIYDKLTESLSIRLTQRDIQKYLYDLHLAITPSWKSEQWRHFLISARTMCLDRKDQIQETGHKDFLRLTKLINNISRLLQEMVPNFDYWVITSDYAGETFRPVSASRYSEDYLFRGVEKVIFSSATITPKDIYELGIKSSELSIHEVKSSFPVNRRPVIYFPTQAPIKELKLSFKTTERQYLHLASHIDTIIKDRLDRKGLILTPSYLLARTIFQMSKYYGLMLIHDKEDFKDVLSEFKQSDPPSIMISPSLSEGEDFPGDLCSYIIIPKIPYLDSRDPYISARKKKDKSLSTRLVARKIIQKAGRGMRKKTDICEIFIIDAHWNHLRNKTGVFPLYFRKAFRRVDSPPKPLRLDC